MSKFLMKEMLDFITSLLLCRAAYKSKKTSEVMRAYLVMSLCGIKPLVDHNAKVGRIR